MIGLLLSLETLLVIGLITILFFVTRKCLQLSDIVEETSKQIEDSLDILDKTYREINRKAHMDIFLDEPVVKSLVRDMYDAKDALLSIANKISTPFGETQNTEAKTIT